MKKRTAIYAGSFDPITNGHLWMIREGAKLFDTLYILVATNPDKKYMFDNVGRYWMVRDAIKSLRLRNLKVIPFDQDFVVQFAQREGISFVLRGIRTVADFDYERALRLINSDISPKVQTVFLMPPRDVAEVSSSLVKGLVGPKGWEKVVARYVPKVVLDEFIKEFTKKSNRTKSLAEQQRR